MRLCMASFVAVVAARSLMVPRGDASSDSDSSLTLAADASGLQVTVNATCGGTLTCLGSTFGDCCSSHNFCGSTEDYCGAGCIPEFGTCGSSSSASPTASATSSSSASSSAAADSSSATTGSSNSSGKSERTISPAAGAGIAVGVTCGVVALGIAGWLWSRRYQSKKKLQQQQQQMAVGDNNNKGLGGGYINDVTGEYYGNDGSGSESSYAMMGRSQTQHTFPQQMVQSPQQGPQQGAEQQRRPSLALTTTRTRNGSFSTNYSAFPPPHTPARSLASSSPAAGRMARSPVTLRSEPPLPATTVAATGPPHVPRASVYEVEGDGDQGKSNRYKYGESPAVELDSNEKEEQAFRFI